jgi:hypothetical protein
MSQTTGDDEMSFHRILQMIRISSIVILLLHFYHSAYPQFLEAGFTSDISDNLLSNLEAAGLFSSPFITKLICFPPAGAQLSRLPGQERTHLYTGYRFPDRRGRGAAVFLQWRDIFPGSAR